MDMRLCPVGTLPHWQRREHMAVACLQAWQDCFSGGDQLLHRLGH